jgi:hypothetical protein
MSLQKESQKQFKSFLSLQMQGRGAEAFAVAKKIPLRHLDKKQRKTIKGSIERFSHPEPLPILSNKPIHRLIEIYQCYWHKVLLQPSKKVSAESALRKATKGWLLQYRGVRIKTSSLDLITKRIKKEVEDMGYYCLTGTVSPWRELEIWQKQHAVAYTVKLPESTEKVRVFLMKNYLSKGWMAYATMELNYPGGWAKKEGLFCNTHAFRLKSERFLISFLRHEAQHYADFRRFPRLDSNDLEYRAKLAEFSSAKKTAIHLFKSFASRANHQNRKNPHAFANFCVLRDLSRKIHGHSDFLNLAQNPKQLNIKRINKAAQELLLEHSENLRTKGAKRVRNFIS